MKKFITYKILLVIALTGFALPNVNAQEDLADATTFGKLVVTEDLSPEERLSKKKELTESALDKAIAKTNEMANDLDTMELEEDSSQENIRIVLLEEARSYTATYETYLDRLETIESVEGMDELINEIISFREDNYTPGAKNILSFILVYSYTPGVLNVAESRYENIRDDVNRLEALELLEAGQLNELLSNAESTLEEAKTLHLEATETLMSKYATTTATLATSTTQLEQATTTPPTARELAEQSLAKVKNLYEIFIDAGKRVEEVLGIN